MLDSPSLISYPFPLRFGFLVVLVFLAAKYTKRSVPNGILLGLITGMSPVPILLFKGSELFPGLPNMISLDRIVWPTVLAVFLFKRSRGETERMALDRIECALLAFVGVVLVSMVARESYIDSDGEWNLFKVIRGYGFPFIAYFIGRRAARDAQQFKGFLVGVGFITTYLVLTGLAEAFHLYPLVFPQFILNSTLGTHFGATRGIFLNASAYGLAIAMALPLLLWLYFTDHSPRRFLWPVIAVLSLVPVVLTFQRAAWLSAVVASGVTVAAWPRRRAILGSALAGLLLVSAACAVLFGAEIVTQKIEASLTRTSTIEYRLAHIERGWAMFKANPVFGVGMNRYALEVENYSDFSSRLVGHAHNTWITLLAELGLVGFFSYLIALAVVLMESFNLYWRIPEYRAVLGLITAMTLAFLTMSASLEIRGHLYSNALLLTLWSMTLGKMRKQSSLRERPAIDAASARTTAVMSVTKQGVQSRFPQAARF